MIQTSLLLTLQYDIGAIINLKPRELDQNEDILGGQEVQGKESHDVEGGKIKGLRTEKGELYSDPRF